jgi:RNA polymerase sigma-70 factor (ECF subfamily)
VVEETGGFETWYRKEHPRVLGALYLLSGEPDVARDATDEAFARALSHWSKVESMESPGGWVYRVALNVLRRTLRRRSTEARLLERQAQPEGGTAPGPLPEVWQAVAQLPGRQRTAVVLRFVADLPEADIATAMGVRRGTVSSTLALARRRLSELLQDDVDIDPREEVSHA